MDLSGRTLGQFRIIEPIGQGGMASVFKAYQPSLDRYVAIKVLPAQHALTPGFSERFVREARAIAQLSHPNILPVIDFGQEGDLSYIVIKYVPAGTLKDIMGRPMELEEASRLIESIAAALDHAHKRGILHRDVKPSNVLLEEGDWVLLADFGLAKMVAGDEELTASGVGIGTPAYMSPEQGQGIKVDTRTDIYALGVVLYEMVTGHLPFDAETPFGIVMKHINEPLPLPRNLRPDLPEAVERVILKALAKAPGDRFETAGDLARALRGAITAASHPEPITVADGSGEMLDLPPDLYTQALGYYYTEQWAKAVESLETIVDVQSDYERGDAARRLEHAREQLRLADLYSQAQADLADEEWTAAIECLSAIIAADAGYRDAEMLLQQARDQKQLVDLYADARRLHDSGQWQAVVNIWGRIHALAPDYADPDGLLTAAQAQLEKVRAEEEARRESEQRARHLANLYRRGMDHVAASEWHEAAAVFEEIESREPGYQETTALLERARREIAALDAAQGVEIGVDKRLPTAVDVAGMPLWRKRWPLLVAGALGVIVVGAIIFLVTSGNGTTAPDTVQPGQAAAVIMMDTFFVSDRDGKREIYRLGASGEGVRWTHAPGSGESWSPALGPDNTLFFTSNRDGKREIYRMDESGEATRWTYTPGNAESWSPALGPDDTLYFTSSRDGKREIYRLDKSGEVVRWTSTSGNSESWSPALGPDGTLYFTSDRDGKLEIYRLERSGETVRWTSTPGGGESWSPALGPDNTLYFTSNRDGRREIYRLDRSGETVRWTFTPNDLESWSPVWGPDDTLLFTSNRSGRRELYQVDRSGNVTQVTETPGNGESWLSTLE